MKAEIPAAQELAGHIIKERFGGAAEVTCRSLQKNGVQKLPELVQSTGLPAATLRRALLILMQHSCVSSYLQTEEQRRGQAQPRVTYVYQLETTAAVQTLRMPDMLLCIRDNFEITPAPEDTSLQTGAVAESFLNVLFQHGRLSKARLLGAVTEALQAESDDVSDQLGAVFGALLQQRLVEQCPPSTLPRIKTQIHDNAVKRRGRAEKEATDAEISARAAELAHRDYRSARFSEAASPQAATDRSNGAEHGEAAADVPAAKRRRVDGDLNTGAAGEHVPVWRANMGELTRRLKLEACVQLVGDKHGPRAAGAVAAMLQSPWGPDGQSEPVPLGTVWRTAQRLARGSNPAGAAAKDERELQSVLSMLLEDEDELIGSSGHSVMDTRYWVNVDRVVAALRRKELEASIRQQFGQPGLRVYRLLVTLRQLEQKQVSEKAMLPMKDTRELLYRMLKAGTISLQDIPKAADHVPSRTMYTLHADSTAADGANARSVFKAALNVKLRLEHEHSQHQEARHSELAATSYKVLELVSPNVDVEKRRVAIQLYGDQVKRYLKIQNFLQIQLLNLSRLIALFNDY